LRQFPVLSIAFSTSFSFEDQALTHVIAEERLPIRLFTLDTGRLFEETHKLHQETRDLYGLAIETFYPDAEQVQAFVAQNGINGFYNSVENRKACCHIRKVEPLKRALKGVDIWISGLRREHSESREQLGCTEWDSTHRVVKFYPLIDVGSEDLWAFIRANKIPFNPMHERGFPSIGCEPCTRAIQPGESPRAGRWWWEKNGEQECGLHMQDGKLVRAKMDAT
jgi:phosphoadenosine phosphosulfate reductase